MSRLRRFPSRSWRGGRAPCHRSPPRAVAALRSGSAAAAVFVTSLPVGQEHGKLQHPSPSHAALREVRPSLPASHWSGGSSGGRWGARGWRRRQGSASAAWLDPVFPAFLSRSATSSPDARRLPWPGAQGESRRWGQGFRTSSSQPAAWGLPLNLGCSMGWQSSV